MKTEIEVKFADIDIAAIRSALKAAGASCGQPMRLMKREASAYNLSPGLPVTDMRNC